MADLLHWEQVCCQKIQVAMKFKYTLLFILITCIAGPLYAKDVHLKNKGAKADGKTKVTQLFQKAIDEVSESGGGKVILSGGTFLTGPIELKSGVELYINADAVLLGSPDLEDYPDRTSTRHFATDSLPRWRNIALIYADEAENIAITGRGVIDCNGKNFVAEKQDTNWTGWKYERSVPYKQSVPRACFFAGCNHVTVRDVTMVNQPAGWSYWIHDCDNVVFDACKIYADVRYPNNDGIHVNSSRDVTISNCIVECGDDAIVIRANNRSLKENKVCERVVVTNCVLRSWSCGVRLGWTNDGVIRNCSFSNIIMHDTSNGIHFYLPPKRLHSNDYGREATLVENITFSDIQMNEIYGSSIYVCVDSDEGTLFKGFRNVTFNNVYCKCLNLPYFSGRKDALVENITFNNCVFEKYDETDFPGDLKRHGAIHIGDPAHNLEYVKNLVLNNSRFTTKP